MGVSISVLGADDLQGQMHGLAALLHACVLDGASVGFVLPFTIEESEAFWTHRVLPGLRDGAVTLWIAREGARIVGSVQLDHGTMPNQRHRAEVRKLLVHPGFRRRGIAKALMAALERHAAQLQRTLLTLDTRTGDKAEPLYASLGYQVAGIIPDYCRDTIEPRLDPTTVMFKRL